jgi:hypothetical protein
MHPPSFVSSAPMGLNMQQGTCESWPANGCVLQTIHKYSGPERSTGGHLRESGGLSNNRHKPATKEVGKPQRVLIKFAKVFA